MKLDKKTRGFGSHQEEIRDGQRVWVEPTKKQSLHNHVDYGLDRSGFSHTRKNSSQDWSQNRVFIWRDPDKGINNPIVSFPDKVIPNLYCPDCHCPAVETDQIGVALCSGTPGWFFYYRQQVDGVGQPEPTTEIVNGELQTVMKAKTIRIERDPLGGFKQIKKEG